LLTSVQYSHSAWFLDGKTSILVLIQVELQTEHFKDTYNITFSYYIRHI